MTQTPAARAFLIFAGLLVGVVSAVVVLLALGYGKTSQTTENTGDTKELARQIAAITERIEDCSSAGGKCYQENQKRTGAAIQAVLDAQQSQMIPHRLRNEAENLCQVEIFAGIPPISGAPVDQVIKLYSECVLRRSGGTEPPPLPSNPYVTTTTTMMTNKKGQP